MSKYIGILILLLGISCSWVLNQKTATIDAMLQDYNEQEIETNEFFKEHIKDMSKQFQKDSLKNEYILGLHPQISIEDPYSLKVRQEIIQVFNDEQIDFDSRQTNVGLFADLVSELRHKVYQQKVALIVDDIKIEGDSMKISISPILYNGYMDSLKYYIKGVEVHPSALENYQGEMTDLMATFVGPITASLFKIYGRN